MEQINVNYMRMVREKQGNLQTNLRESPGRKIFVLLKLMEGEICRMEPEVRKILGAMDDFSQKEKAEKATERDRTGLMGLLNAELKRKGAYGHSKRVARLCERLGKKLGFGDEECEFLFLSALLHDMGKMFIPGSLIEKPSKLDARENEWMKMHPGLGGWLALKTQWLSQFAKPIMQHQEKFDGSGYPDRLKGEEISLHARIIAVADSYDTMVDGKRSYKKRLAHENALEEIRGGAGTHFDPKIVDAFVEMLEERNAMRKTG